MKHSSSKVAVREWVDSNIFDPVIEPEKSYEKTVVFRRDPRELLDGVEIREIDLDSDTIPGELIDIIIP